MEKYDVNITEPAEDDLRDVVKYISSQLNAPVAAINMLDTINEAISKLELNALHYSLVRDDRLAALGYRSMVVKNYLVFFIVNEKNNFVDVDRILHGRRDWQNIL